MEDQTVGSRIKLIRKKKKVTIVAFSQIVGVSISAVNQWEAGKTKPRDTTLFVISSKFNCDYNWLKTGEGEPDRKLENPIDSDDGTSLDTPITPKSYTDPNPYFDELINKMYRIHCQGDQRARDKLDAYLSALDPGPSTPKPPKE